MASLKLRNDRDSVPAYVPGRRVRPVDGREFKLSSNELPWPADRVVLDRAHAVLEQTNRYPDLFGMPLVERLSEHLQLPTDRVLVGPGSLSLLQLLLLAAVNPGDSVVYPWRSFEAYPILVHASHSKPVAVPLRDWGLDVEAMADAAIDSGAPVVMVCNPNNPTGRALSTAELTHLIETVPCDRLILLDEAYREFADGPDHPDGLELAQQYPNVAVFRTFSKAHGLAGLRVGYCVVPAEVEEVMRRLALPFPLSDLAQGIASAALDHWPVQQRRVQEVIELRSWFTEQLRKQGHQIPTSAANFVWLASGPDTDRLTADLADAGVSVRTYSGEGIRITIGEPQGLERVLTVTERWPGLGG